MSVSKRPLVIGLAGGSGSGKTHLAHEIAASAGEDHVSILSMDQYFRNIEDPSVDPANINFDHPRHLDFHLLIDHIRRIKAGHAVMAPSYDFVQMRQTLDSIRIEPKRVLIVEGLFVLAEPLVSLCDLTCFLDVATDERLLGRILRDSRERGASIEQVVDRYQRFVRPSYQIFVAPTMQNADVVVDFTFRRSLFSKLLSHLVTDSIRDEIDTTGFVESLRRENYMAGAQFEKGYMPLTTDIFMLSQAYPEVVVPLDPRRTRLASPALSTFRRIGHNHEENH